MGSWVDRAEELAAAEEWELVEKVPGPRRCTLSQQMVPGGSFALRIRGKASGGLHVVGQGVARDYFNIRAPTRLDDLLAELRKHQ